MAPLYRRPSAIRARERAGARKDRESCANHRHAALPWLKCTALRAAHRRCRRGRRRWSATEESCLRCFSRWGLWSPCPAAQRCTNSYALQTRGLKPFTAVELDSVDVPALVGALRAGRSFAVAPGIVVPAATALLHELQAPPARSPAVAAAPLGGQQLVQASPFSRRLSGAELNREPPPLSHTSSANSTPSTSSDDDDDDDDGDDGYDASVRVQAPTAALPQPPLELFAPGVLAKGTHSCRNAGGVRFLIPYACGPRRFRRRACGCRIPTARCVVHLGWWCFTNSYRVRARAAGRGAPILGSHSKRFAKVACRRQR